jgi:hypothetical protein
MIIAFDVLGGDFFIQLAKWRIELGDEQAFIKLVDVSKALARKRSNHDLLARERP